MTKPSLSPISCIFLLLLSESCPDLRLQPCSIWCCEAVLGIPKFKLDSKILKNTTGSHGQSIHFIHQPTLTWSPKNATKSMVVLIFTTAIKSICHDLAIKFQPASNFSASTRRLVVAGSGSAAAWALGQSRQNMKNMLKSY